MQRRGSENVWWPWREQRSGDEEQRMGRVLKEDTGPPWTVALIMYVCIFVVQRETESKRILKRK